MTTGAGLITGAGGGGGGAVGFTSTTLGFGYSTGFGLGYSTGFGFITATGSGFFSAGLANELFLGYDNSFAPKGFDFGTLYLVTDSYFFSSYLPNGFAFTFFSSTIGAAFATEAATAFAGAGPAGLSLRVASG